MEKNLNEKLMLVNQNDYIYNNEQTIYQSSNLSKQLLGITKTSGENAKNNFQNFINPNQSFKLSN